MIDLTTITTYISPIIVVACLVVGYVIKHAIDNKTVNAFIPMILATLGAVANIWAMGAITLEVLVTGGVSGLAATGMYEAFKNVLKLSADSDPIVFEESVKGKHFNKEGE